MYRNIPNALSFLRLLMAPFVLVLPKDVLFPFFCCAGLTDLLDGFLARKLKVSSTLGTILDPLADKVFAVFCGYLFYTQGLLSPFCLFALFSRDVSLLLFVVYLFLSKRWKSWSIHSFYSGKVSTGLQALVFSCLALDIFVPSIFYSLFIVVALLAFFELGFRSRLLLLRRSS
jgi:phosphatidylglycerophosphate synthase